MDEWIFSQEIRDEMRQMYTVAEAKLDEARAMVAADHQGAFARWVRGSAPSQSSE